MKHTTYKHCQHPAEAVQRCIGGYYCGQCRTMLTPAQAIHSQQTRTDELEQHIAKLEQFISSTHDQTKCARCGCFLPRRNTSDGLTLGQTGVTICATCLPEFWDEEVNCPMSLEDQELKQARQTIAHWLLTKGRDWLDFTHKRTQDSSAPGRGLAYRMLGLAQSVGYDPQGNHTQPWATILLRLP